MKKPKKRKTTELAGLASSPEVYAGGTKVEEKASGASADGQLYRPIKQSVTIRLDADVVAWFKGREDHYQTAINRVLRKHMLKRLG